MSDRRTPDDLLANILGGKKPPVEPPPPSNQTTQPQVSIASTSTTPKSQPTTEEQQAAEKIKATFYLREGAVNDLEDLWMKARQLAPKDKRTTVSKSLLVEVALSLLVEEFTTKGIQSRLFNALDD